MVEFSFQLAGPGSRFLAWVIDTLIMLAGKALTPWTRADRRTGKSKAQEVAA